MATTHQNQRRPQGGRDRRGENPRGRQSAPRQDQPGPEIKELCERVTLARKAGELDPGVFDEVARKAAEIVGAEGRNLNKTSQLRKFYDELLMWEGRVNGKEPDGAKDRLREFLPLIRMLNAKAAYAQGRKHVGPDFVYLLRTCLEQVKSEPEVESGPETLRHVRLFFEAFMGFYKIVGPDAN